jgi:hypothetical protein
MRVIIATLISILAAGPSWALEWVSVDPKHDTTAAMFMTDSAYVDKASGLIHVELCTGGVSIPCHAPNDPQNLSDNYVTDAVIDCAKRTITWRDFMEGVNVATVLRPGQAGHANAAHHSPFERRRRVEIASVSDEGLVFEKFCAEKASLPRRLAPGAPGAGFSLRLVDEGAGAGPPPTAGDQLALMLGASATARPGAPAGLVWLRPEAIVDRSALESARSSIDANLRPIIELRLTEEGAQRLAEATRDNAGRRLAVVLDGQVLTVAVIQTEIASGFLTISGDFTTQSAQGLARSIAVWTDHPAMEDD